MSLVTVRWNDGYMEDFKCSDVRFGSDLLWLRLETGQNRHIIVSRQVRWWSVYPESHEVWPLPDMPVEVVEKKKEAPCSEQS